RRGTAVAQVLARRDRIDRNAVAICRPHDLLHLLGGRRAHGRRDRDLRRLAHERRIRILVHRDVFVAGEHPVRPYGTTKLLERSIPVARADSFRTRHSHHSESVRLEGLLRVRYATIASSSASLISVLRA